MGRNGAVCMDFQTEEQCRSLGSGAICMDYQTEEQCRSWGHGGQEGP